MKNRSASLTNAILGALLGFICAARPVAAGEVAARGETVLAETSSDALGPGTAPPPAAASLSPQTAHARRDDSTLEIAPPPALKPARSITDAISAKSKPKPDEASAAAFNPGAISGAEGARPGPRPYLGITIGFPSHPEAGRRSLEILSVDPGSPAEKAGLEGRVGATAAGALLGPLGPLTTPLLRKTGSLGHAGDQIIAVDDRRVRTREELDDALSAARPGQIVYLAVVRSLPDGQRKTLRAAVQLGGASQYTAAQPQH